MSVICSLESVRSSDAGSDPIRYLTVPVPRFGEARFQSLSAKDLRALSGKANEEILRYSLVDEDGHTWVDDEVIDYMKSEKFDGQVLLTLTNIAMKLCADDDVDGLIAAAVREAAKNSSNGRMSLTTTA